MTTDEWAELSLLIKHYGMARENLGKAIARRGDRTNDAHDFAAYYWTEICRYAMRIVHNEALHDLPR